MALRQLLQPTLLAGASGRSLKLAPPDPAIDGVAGWRLKDLVAWLRRTHDITLDATTISRARKAFGCRKLSARPRHPAQEDEVIEAFKKGFPAAVEAVRAKVPGRTVIEVGWQSPP